MAEFRCAIEFRQDDTRLTPGRMFGTLIRYGEVASDRRELFMPGALYWPTDGILVREMHNRQAPIVRVVPEVRGNLVVIDAPLPDTTRGRDMAVGIRERIYSGLSVEFAAEREDVQDGIRRIHRAALRGAGLVDDPAYAGSRVEVRGKRRRALWPLL